MVDTVVSCDEVLAGFDKVARLYPHTPSLALWRAWEVAVYARCRLVEPVLDLGCGDGAFFRLVWPSISNVVGVDHDEPSCAAARASGVYRQVLRSAAQTLPIDAEQFNSCFANCSVEHMDDVASVFRGVCRGLKPGGEFLFSVITDKISEWNPLPALAAKLGGSATKVEADFRNYHHYRTPPSLAKWAEHLTSSGFEVVEHFPILPEVMTRACTFMDAVWHLGAPAELGTELHSYLSRYPKFPDAMRHFIRGMFAMEQRSDICGGAVLRARKPS